MVLKQLRDYLVRIAEINDKLDAIGVHKEQLRDKPMRRDEYLKASNNLDRDERILTTQKREIVIDAQDLVNYHYPDSDFIAELDAAVGSGA